MAFTLTRRVNFTGTANPGGKRDAFGEEPGDEEDGAAAEGAATQGPFHSGSMERQQTRPGGQLMRYALEGARSDEDEDGDDVLGEGQPAAASLLGGPALGTAAAAVGSPRGVPRLDLGKGEAVRGGRGDSHQGPQSNRSDSSQGGPRSARLSAFRQGSHNASFRMVRSSAFFAAAMVHREDDSIHPDYRRVQASSPSVLDDRAGAP